jgi:hypothetical protein
MWCAGTEEERYRDRDVWEKEKIVLKSKNDNYLGTKFKCY